MACESEYTLRAFGVYGGSYPVSKSEGDHLQKMSKSIVLLLEVEQLFSVIVDTFKDLEKLIFSKALDDLLEDIEDADGLERSRIEGFQTSILLNSKLLAFLSATKAYEEHLRIISDSLGGGSLRALMDSEISRSSEGHFSFRLFRALRNLSQHVSLPVHGFVMGRHREPRPYHGGRSRSRVSFEPMLSREKLLEEAASCHMPTKKVLLELNQYKESNIHLRFLLFRFLSELAGIHNKFRGETSELFDYFEGELKSAEERYLGTSDYGGQITIGRSTDDFKQHKAIDKSVGGPLRRQRKNFRRLETVHERYVGMSVHNYSSDTLILEGDMIYVEDS